MTTFRQAVESRTAAPSCVVPLPLSAWAPSYPDKPAGDMQVGLRLYAEADAIVARSEAARAAWRLHPQDGDGQARIEAYNGAVMTALVARSACDPCDGTISFFGRSDGSGSEIDVARKLTPRAIEYLFEELDAVLTAESPTAPEADDDDLAWLSGALTAGEVWNTLSATEVRRIRRMLARAIDDMRGERG